MSPSSHDHEQDPHTIPSIEARDTNTTHEKGLLQRGICTAIDVSFPSCRAAKRPQAANSPSPPRRTFRIQQATTDRQNYPLTDQQPQRAARDDGWARAAHSKQQEREKSTTWRPFSPQDQDLQGDCSCCWGGSHRVIPSILSRSRAVTSAASLKPRSLASLTRRREFWCS